MIALIFIRNEFINLLSNIIIKDHSYNWSTHMSNIIIAENKLINIFNI